MTQAPMSPAVGAFWRYAHAFQALDPTAVAASFHEPALMITPKGVHPLPDAQAVEQHYAEIMAELPESYARTEFTTVEERRLGEDLSEIHGAGTWLDREGKSFMPFGMTYVLRRSGVEWRIVTALIHAPGASG
jgi:ketosteroid isomerase-like protein